MHSISSSGLTSFLLAGMLLVIGPGVAIPADQTPVWQLTPYRVQVLLAVEPRLEFSGPWVADFQAQLQSRIVGVIGGLWRAQLVPAPSSLQDVMLIDLEDVRPEQLPAGDVDKLLLLSLTQTGRDYTAAVREFDVRSATLSPVVRRSVTRPCKLADAAIHAMWRSFAALALIQQVKGDQITVRVRGSGLALRDRQLALLAVDDALRPLVRYNEPDGSLNRIVRLPSTLLAVQTVEPSKAKTRLHSAMPVALAGARGVRSEPLALRVVASDRPTNLVLQNGGDPAKPVAGCDLLAATPGSLPRVAARTDRQGTAALVRSAAPLQLVYAVRGEEPLGLLPLVPGEQSRVVLTVPDHSKRLAAEGLLAGLRDDLVDVLTLREVLIVRARAQIKARQLAEAQATLAELEGLATRDKFVIALILAKKRTTAGDAAEQAQIDALFAETQAQAEKHLTSEPITKLAAELKSAGK